MKQIKYVLLAMVMALFATPSFAQMTEDPTSWKYEVKKTGDAEYQLIFHLNLKTGWHIWSMHPGGDGMEIVPSFAFDKNPNMKLKGDATEKGKATTTTMAGIDGKITYLNGKIDYIQTVIVKGKTKITGKQTYQVCNDNMCLAPKDKDFSFEIK